MLLANIIQEVALKTGLTDRSRLLAYINSSLDEILDGMDFYDLYQEMAVETSKPIVTLPYFVRRLRGIKICGSRHETIRHTIVPLYHDGAYYVDGYVVRDLGAEVLHTAVQDTSKLNFEFTEGLSEDVQVTVVGRTDYAESASEVLEFGPERAVLETNNKYEHIIDIQKSNKTKSNLVVRDVLGNELCLIPNSYLTVRHIVLQVYEQDKELSTPLKFRILYIPNIPPLLNDTDSFPDLYGRILVHRSIMNIFLDVPDKLQLAEIYATKADNELKRVTRSLAEGQERLFKRSSRAFKDYIYHL